METFPTQMEMFPIQMETFPIQMETFLNRLETNVDQIMLCSRPLISRDSFYRKRGQTVMYMMHKNCISGYKLLDNKVYVNLEKFLI